MNYKTNLHMTINMTVRRPIFLCQIHFTSYPYTKDIDIIINWRPDIDGIVTQHTSFNFKLFIKHKTIIFLKMFSFYFLVFFYHIVIAMDCLGIIQLFTNSPNHFIKTINRMVEWWSVSFLQGGRGANRFHVASFTFATSAAAYCENIHCKFLK